MDQPPALNPENLPTYLAIPLAELQSEQHPSVRLHWLVTCAENALRWSVALALAETLQANQGRLPEYVVKQIRDQIERPSLGHWLAILRALSSKAPDVAHVPAVFSLYSSLFARNFLSEGEKGGTLDNSLLVLRNQLAHGGGLRKAAARRLLACHRERVYGLLSKVTEITATGVIVANTGGQTLHLRGTRPSPIPVPAGMPAGNGPYLIGPDGAALPLWPLADFGPVRHVESREPLAATQTEFNAQLYLRADRERLVYVPLGTDDNVSLSFELERFRTLFQLDVPMESAQSTFATNENSNYFLAEARRLSDDLVGRVAELHQVKAWLKGRDSRQSGVATGAWIFGPPGAGKSLLMARVANDLSNSKPEQQALYYHRFRAGDLRNNTRAFLCGLLTTLTNWPLLHDEAIAAVQNQADIGEHVLNNQVRAQLERIAALPAPKERAPRPRFVVMLDGLDEILSQAGPRLPNLLRELMLPGTIWLLAGRPEPLLQRAFTPPRCDWLFSGGFPPMSAVDIRAMLIEGLPNSQYPLIARDQDGPDGVSNPFIERVIACADGLPLYIHLLLDDLRNGRLSVHDEQRLPDGLTAYYQDLMARFSVSDLARELPLLIALLARADEPLGQEALTRLLAEPEPVSDAYRVLTKQALDAAEALLRRLPTPEGTLGYGLYHQSFRDFISGEGARPTPDNLRLTIDSAQNRLCRLATTWQRLPPGNLRNHLFRQGVGYALRWQPEQGLLDARERLTDFAFLMAYAEALPAAELTGLVQDYDAVLRSLDAEPRVTFRHWEAFFRERKHILLRGTPRWPAHRILLQIAIEHADDSPVTQAAEAWLNRGQCDWIWLRNPRRPQQVSIDPCIKVLEGHSDRVNGVLVMADNRVLSWSADHSLRIWDLEQGVNLQTLVGHTGTVRGAIAVGSDRLLSWSADNSLRLWDVESGELIARLSDLELSFGEDSAAALLLDNGSILSWQHSDKQLHLWNSRDGTPLSTIACDPSSDPVALPGGRFACPESDGSLRVWASDGTEALPPLHHHSKAVKGLRLLSPEQLLSWSGDEFCLWDLRSGKCVKALADRRLDVSSVIVLHDERILSWGEFSVQVSDLQGERLLATLDSPTGCIENARDLPDGRVVSWSDEKCILDIWDGYNEILLAQLRGKGESILGVETLSDDRLLAWGYDNRLWVWDLRRYRLVGHLTGHPERVCGVKRLANGRILSWDRDDGTLRLWDVNTEIRRPFSIDHAHKPEGIERFAAQYLVSWADDYTPRVWNLHDGRAIALLRGHSDRTGGSMFTGISGIQRLSRQRLLTWAKHDPSLCVWDLRNGTSERWRGHSVQVGGTTILQEGHILSWDSYNEPDMFQDINSSVADASALRFTNKYYRWRDKALKIWDSETGIEILKLVGYSGWVAGAVELPNRRILAWSGGGAAAIWEPPSTIGWLRSSRYLFKASHPVNPGRLRRMAATVPARILALAVFFRRLLRIGRLAPIKTLPHQIVGNVEVLPNARFLSFPSDEEELSRPSPKLWDDNGDYIATLSTNVPAGFRLKALANGRIVSSNRDEDSLLWSGDDGSLVATLAGMYLLVLTDGTVVTRAGDCLHLWNSDDGRPLTKFDSLHGDPLGVTRLNGDGFVAWDRDGVLQIWETAQDAVTSQVIDATDAPWQRPDALFAKAAAESEHLTADQSVAWSQRSTIGIAARDQKRAPVCWHGHASIAAHDLDPAGILAISLGNGPVYCLQLYAGNRRITLQEYQTS